MNTFYPFDFIMINTILCAVLSFFLGCILVYLFGRKKIKQTIQIDAQTAEKNRTLKNELAQLEKQKINAQINLEREIENAQKQKDIAEARLKEELDKLCAHNEEIAEKEYQLRLEMLKNQYKNAEEVAAINFERSINCMREEYEKNKEEIEKEYLTVLDDYSEEYRIKIDSCTQEINRLSDQIIALKTIESAAVEASKRAEEIRTQGEFYKLQIPEEDLAEIKMLREAAKTLRNQEPLCKVIWKYYYEKPTSDLISRVVGSEIKTGIYKITNLENNMCYVGQAADISARFKQHIKRGLGAESPNKNKLYPALASFGVENFSFEIIEECPREELDAKEGYWIDFFQGKEYGYNIRRV